VIEQVEVDPAYIEVKDLAEGCRTHFASGARNRHLRLCTKRLVNYDWVALVSRLRQLTIQGAANL
jgi:hypothetical protein